MCPAYSPTCLQVLDGESDAADPYRPAGEPAGYSPDAPLPAGAPLRCHLVKMLCSSNAHLHRACGDAVRHSGQEPRPTWALLGLTGPIYSQAHLRATAYFTAAAHLGLSMATVHLRAAAHLGLSEPHRLPSIYSMAAMLLDMAPLSGPEWRHAGFTSASGCPRLSQG